MTVVPRSVSLDGTDDYVSVPNNSALSGLTNISLEAWVFIESTSRQGIFDQHTSPTSGWWVDFNNNSGGFRLARITQLGASSLSTNPQLNIWHHIALHMMEPR
ncbi:MAG: LamG-like jellyroll fold domain-containing protein [Balneola sp.]